MKSIVRIALCLSLLAVAFGPSFAADGDVTLEGEFVWARDDGDRTGPLKAVFTPTGKNTWDVAFHFDWEDGPHVYAGTAKGNLKKGALSGEVANDNEERPSTFTFKGKFNKEGLFEGDHGAMRDGEHNPLGTLTLKSAG